MEQHPDGSPARGARNTLEWRVILGVLIALLKHRILVDVGQALLESKKSGGVLHHRRQDRLVLRPYVGITHGRMLFVLDTCQ